MTFGLVVGQMKLGIAFQKVQKIPQSSKTSITGPLKKKVGGVKYLRGRRSFMSCKSSFARTRSSLWRSNKVHSFFYFFKICCSSSLCSLKVNPTEHSEVITALEELIKGYIALYSTIQLESLNRSAAKHVDKQ
jgi:hypothetical protein